MQKSNASNAESEAFFNIMKNFQTNKKKHIRPAEFINHMEEVSKGGVVKCHINSYGITSTRSVEQNLEKLAFHSTPQSQERSPSIKTTPSTTPRSTKRRQKIIEYDGDIGVDDEPSSMENWGPKRKRMEKKSYYDGNKIEQILKKI